MFTADVVRRFADMEIFVELQENVRGEDVFIVQSTSFPANDHLMELLIMIDAARRSSARRVTAVIPYFGYARQDRRTSGRTPISAKLVANLITSAGANRVLTLDLHAGQIQGFFNIPFDHLYATPVFRDTLKEAGLHGNDGVIVSPDAGGVDRARIYSKMLECSLAIIDKRRESPNVSQVLHLIGDVHLVTSTVFDVGVYLIVLGFVLDLVRSLGAGLDQQAAEHRTPLPRPESTTAVPAAARAEAP